MANDVSAASATLVTDGNAIVSKGEDGKLPSPVFSDPRDIQIYKGDCLKVLNVLANQHPDGCFDMIFADPPYFLSNGGITCRGGKTVKVDKGDWDKSQGIERNHEFNTDWLCLCQRLLKPDGTIWVTGTSHNIFSFGFGLQQLGFKIINDIAWEKPNPPPNLSCRCFTHSTETVIWAAKSHESRHCFNYDLMRQQNENKQMKTVWRIGRPRKSEQTFGNHPTQKPNELLERCLLASTNEGDLVLDPFLGSGTSAVACAKHGRRCIGIEMDAEYIALASARVKAEPRLCLCRGEDPDPPKSQGHKSLPLCEDPGCWCHTDNPKP